MADSEPAISPTRRGVLAAAGAATVAPLLNGCAGHAATEPAKLEAAVAALVALEPLRPEDFGATGRGGDQTRALAAMMAEARRRGRARIVLRAGASYAGTNPFIWGGLRELLIEGNGAQLSSARTTKPPGSFEANFAQFRSPTAMLPNGVELLDFGASQGGGKTDLGIRLRSAAKGATMLASLDGAPLPVGPLLVYGWDRLGFDGMPPSPMCWEWVDADPVAGAPDRVRLRAPLRYGYDEKAPEYAFTSDPGLRYGAARVLPLARRGGAMRELVPLDLLVVRDVRFPLNPRFDAKEDVAFSGIVGFGGARHILLERIVAPNLFVNCAETVTLRGATIAEDFEIDKLLGTVTLEDCTIGKLVGAIGAREVVVGPGTRVARGTWLAPTEALIARGARFAGDVGSTRALIGFYVHGSRAVTLESCTFEASNPEADRFVEAAFFTAAFRLAAADQLALSRAAYDASGVFRNLFVGAVLFDQRNRPAARVTRLPWCPGGDLLRGEVRIGIAQLARLGSAPQLRLPVIAGLTIRDPKVEGPHAARITTVFGTSPNRTADSLLAVVDGLELGARSIRLTSDITALDQPNHSFYTLPGRSFVPSALRFEVVRPARRATGVIFVGADTDDGRDVSLLRGVDLSRTGVQQADLGGILAGAGILSLRVNDPSRALPAADRARWLLAVEGRFR